MFAPFRRENPAHKKIKARPTHGTGSACGTTQIDRLPPAQLFPITRGASGHFLPALPGPFPAFPCRLPTLGGSLKKDSGWYSSRSTVFLYPSHYMASPGKSQGQGTLWERPQICVTAKYSLPSGGPFRQTGAMKNPFSSPCSFGVSGFSISCCKERYARRKGFRFCRRQEQRIYTY